MNAEIHFSRLSAVRLRRGGKGALYRETLQATGFHMGRVVIASAEFAPMPPFIPGYPGGSFRRPSDCVSEASRNLSIRCGFLIPNPSRTSPPANVQTRVQEHAGRIVLSPIVLMSSGRLFLDRVGRHQGPSPLRRHLQNISIAGSKGTIYHRTVSSVLTGLSHVSGQPQVVA